MIRAVIFDMDGVLIDSEIVYLTHMWKTMLPQYPKLKVEQLYPLVGMDDKKTNDVLYELLGEGEDFDVFCSELKLSTGFCPINFPEIMRPEVPGLLTAIKDKGFKLALASSSPRSNIETVLTECGIIEYFDYIISGQDLKESKPNPEIYLLTANELGCEPEECFVIEDSTYGVLAGKSANMTVAALKDDRFSFDQSEADYRINNLDELKAILKI